MDILHSFYERTGASQDQVTCIKENMQREICEELHLNDLIPVTLLTDQTNDDLQAFKRIILQVYDASCCRFTSKENQSGQSTRQLTRLEVMVWATTAGQQDADDQSNLRLKYRGDYRLWVVLDRSFEITSHDSKPWSSLCIEVSSDHFEQLFQDSNELEDLIDSAITLGSDLEIGCSPVEAQENNCLINKAYRRKLMLFGDVKEIEAKLGSIADPADINLYMKRGAFEELPKVLDWRASVQASTLKQYLNDQ